MKPNLKDGGKPSVKLYWLFASYTHKDNVLIAPVSSFLHCYTCLHYVIFPPFSFTG